MSDKVIARSINISEKKGTKKTPVSKATFIEGHGIEGDSHAGPWHRQVTLLAVEEIEAADAGRGIATFGSFAENISIEGIDIRRVRPLDKFLFGDVILEVTQIGKECHDNCAIGKALGECIMPKLGVFTRTIQGGEVESGAGGIYQPKCFKAMVITLSDRASRGEYDDMSGPAAAEAVEHFFGELGYEYDIEKRLIPDDPGRLAEMFAEAETECFDLVVTSGGTGIGPRDFTPEITAGFIDRAMPGVMEFIRNKYGSKFPNALLSRAIAGVKGNMLVYNLPGSPKAVREYMSEIVPTLKHSFYMLHGLDMH
jgi:molybdopterin adenylyltransferase